MHPVTITFSDTMQAALSSACFDDRPRLRALTTAGLCPRAAAGGRSLGGCVLDTQDRGHTRDAQAEVGEAKASLRLHADIMASEGRRGLPGEASRHISDREAIWLHS